MNEDSSARHLWDKQQIDKKKNTFHNPVSQCTIFETITCLQVRFVTIVYKFRSICNANIYTMNILLKILFSDNRFYLHGTELSGNSKMYLNFCTEVQNKQMWKSLV